MIAVDILTSISNSYLLVVWLSGLFSGRRMSWRVSLNRTSVFIFNLRLFCRNHCHPFSAVSRIWSLSNILRLFKKIKASGILLLHNEPLNCMFVQPVVISFQNKLVILSRLRFFVLSEETGPLPGIF